MKDDGNQIDYGVRVYDPRLGKFLSLAPLQKKCPHLTPYQFASNKPMDGVDQDGLEWRPMTGADGNVVDYTWAGFNADGSFPMGTVSGGSIVRDGATYNYSSSLAGNYRMGGLSINDGSNVQMNALIFDGGTSVYSFDEINEDGRIKDVFESGTLGNATGASGGQIGSALNKKYNNYVLVNTPHQSDAKKLMVWVYLIG